MHSRRLSTLLLGLWLGGCLFMGWVAMHNLGAVDEAMKNPSDRVQRELRDIGLDRARTVLRFQASELNRNYFSTWELVQIVLGIVTAITLLFATNGNRLVMTLAAAMLALVIIQHLTITPQMIEIGRGLDFAPPDDMLDERKSHRGYHSYYSWLEVLKVLLGVGLAGRMLFAKTASGRKRRSARKKLDTVDDPDDSHIDG